MGSNSKTFQHRRQRRNTFVFLPLLAHSHFSGDAHCTPVGVTAEIPVKPLEELRGEIFVSGRYAEFQGQLIGAEQVNSKQLYQKYAPKFQDKNKLFIFNIITNRYKYCPSVDKELLLTRWGPCQFPVSYGDLSSSTTKVHFKDDLFTYTTTGDNQAVHWHLNFANVNLFAYYAGPMLAQDELQVLECVELAAVREYLVQTNSRIEPHTASRRNVPTPSKS
jgi:hypothetical protein